MFTIPTTTIVIIDNGLGNKKNCACRQHLARKQKAAAYRERVDAALSRDEGALPPLQLYEVVRMLLRVFDPAHDRDRFHTTAKIILRGVFAAGSDSANALNSYFSLILNKAVLQGWIAQVKALMRVASDVLVNLRDRRDDHALAHTSATLLLTCLDHERWKLPMDPAKAAVFRVIAGSFLTTLDKPHVFAALKGYLDMCLAAPKSRCQPPTMAVIVALLNRLLSSTKDKDATLNAFCLSMMQVPTVMAEIKLSTFTAKEDVLQYAIHHTQALVGALSDDGNAALFFLGNTCSLFDAQTTIKHTDVQDLMSACVECCLNFTRKHQTRSAKSTKSSSTSSEHPLLGWYRGHTARGHLDAMPRVLGQLRSLWSPLAVRTRFEDVWTETERLRGHNPKDGGLQTLGKLTHQQPPSSSSSPSSSSASSSSSAKPSLASSATSPRPTAANATTTASAPTPASSSSSLSSSWWAPSALRLRQIFQMTSSSHRFVDKAASERVARACAFYQSLYTTIKVANQEVLGAIAFNLDLVPRLWTFMHHIGPKGNMAVFMAVAAAAASGGLERDPLVACLEVACDATRILLTVVDDGEMFGAASATGGTGAGTTGTGSGPLSAEHLILISAFLNRFMYSVIWDHGLSLSTMAKHSDRHHHARATTLLRSCTRLIRLIRDLDDRQQFAPQNHWLLKQARPRTITAQYIKEATAAGGGGGGGSGGGDAAGDRAHTLLRFLPHLVPFRERVKLLRQLLDHHRQRYLSALPQFRTDPMAKIRRTAVLTDGFREIRQLGPDALRDNVRVVFINEQGLPEAGIDERGLFKEFLEQTLKAGFDPEFGLFTATPEGNNTLYPSPTSSVHENHLQLFEYLGRMVGKMIYDGMVVELPLAPFFCNSILGISNTLRDLPALDPDLARNLQFVKTYEGDVSDLGLCFAVDDEVFGHHVTVPLRPGGSAIDVTNDNRILYVHLLADYRLNKQLDKQNQAFARGLTHMVPRHWLRLFTAPELQRLISGDNAPLDINDLKRNAQYIGGYTASHRMIKWLWEVVGRDFSREEQQMFLRFVTSSSKAPVLGFATLQPPFTVRCMNEGDREEVVTVGGVLANFFSRGTDTARLPSASTCFNLLKLPTYKSKKALREKLRYAISQGAGFEMA
ncbi:ubiquitin-protein ligase E3B [Salpingoeca rosetta]|uniref:HECT-type E3 ubiquitin transferase n=1 Tax=Salpingoeca rosetta (strain ATCC 50818 / BSB-021) TaxID=946362 RepID=F2UJ97_SALR5|nr:ubiquitin-protein ligase E3B [Salpingoeca rosetta]EGD77196.1 ubiquitin-protein ligase E3B [Salpingoeca rosetta]|eukprot:XP_004990540.1 ubiquitin-protein ligase E3B [Salpingoeca rosetta]